MSDEAPPATAPRRWLLIVLACLAVGGLAFAIGRFSAFGTTPDTPTTTSAEAPSFIDETSETIAVAGK